MRGGWRVCREHLHHSGWSVMRVSRRCFVPGPMEVFTSPTGLLSLLYGRTSNTSSSSSKEEPHEPRRGRVRTRSSRVVPPPPPRSTYFTKEAIGLALLVFCVSAAWELINSQRGMMTEKLRETFMTTLEVRSSQEEFAMIVDWMGRQPRGQRVRNVTLRPVTIMDEDHIFFGEGGSRSSSSSSCTPEDVEGQRAALVPGYGSHMFRFQGTWMWVIRSEDQSKQRGSSAQRIDRENDVLTLRFLSRRRDVVSDFLSGVRESWSMHVSNRVPIYMSYAYGQRWRLLTERTRRPLSTLYLPDSVMEVVEEMRSFLAMRATYAELGIPWRRGYLFEGPPGTGKTSLAVAVAGELHLPLHLLSLRSESMDDETLLSVVSSLPPRCLLLVEDVENVMAQTSSSSSNGTNNEDRRPGISVSALLNALDGVASSEGRLLIMTTNDSTKLPSPEALLRPGRVDRRVQFRPMANEEGQRMQDSFANLHQHTHVPEHMIKKCLEATGAAPSTPAVMQQCLLEGILAASRVTSS